MVPAAMLGFAVAVVVVVSVVASTAVVVAVAEGSPVGVAVETGPAVAMYRPLVEVGKGGFVVLEHVCMLQAREVVVVVVVEW
jgi:hypothetical protein